MPCTFSLVDFCVVTINGKPSVHAKEVCKALEYRKKIAGIVKVHCSPKNYTQDYQMIKAADFMAWPKYSQKHDTYINEEGVHELLVSSQQPLAK